MHQPLVLSGASCLVSNECRERVDIHRNYIENHLEPSFPVTLSLELVPPLCPPFLPPVLTIVPFVLVVTDCPFSLPAFALRAFPPFLFLADDALFALVSNAAGIFITVSFNGLIRSYRTIVQHVRQGVECWLWYSSCVREDSREVKKHKGKEGATHGASEIGSDVGDSQRPELTELYNSIME